MLDYYNSNQIIPVHQSLPDTNFELFAYQRKKLYENLGIPLTLLENRNILEIGPGVGDNARVLSACRPASLHLVDGNNESLKSLHEKIEKEQLSKHNTKIFSTSAEEFSLPDEIGCSSSGGGGYDLVVCEGVINGNENPDNFLRIISKFVKKEGLLVITTVSPLGIVDQALRRLYKVHAKKLFPEYQDQVNYLARVFSSHLEKLPTSKKIEDWVQDAILHPLSDDYIFSSKEAALTLLDDFAVIGSSPRLLIDFRWHKGLTLESKESLNFISQFEKYEPILVDQRLDNNNFNTDKVNEETRKNLDSVSRQIWKLSCLIWQQDSFGLLFELKEHLELFEGLINNYSNTTTVAIDEFVKNFQPESNLAPSEMPSFAKWWGRGLSYVSFVRNS